MKLTHRCPRRSIHQLDPLASFSFIFFLRSSSSMLCLPRPGPERRRLDRLEGMADRRQRRRSAQSLAVAIARRRHWFTWQRLQRCGWSWVDHDWLALGATRGRRLPPPLVISLLLQKEETKSRRYRPCAAVHPISPRANLKVDRHLPPPFPPQPGACWSQTLRNIIFSLHPPPPPQKGARADCFLFLYFSPLEVT